MGSGLCKDAAGSGGIGGTEQLPHPCSQPRPQQKPLEQGRTPALTPLSCRTETESCSQDWGRNGKGEVVLWKVTDWPRVRKSSRGPSFLMNWTNLFPSVGLSFSF